ncbi:iron-sulfur cluster assembly scaffold protein [Candidatus Peribacteria bacterium]|nr:iron-sulfur cluster assembly scaffold protein [Candidatus Peribacteria bacterium]
MDLYAENILDHYRHPRNKLPLPAGEGRGLPVRSSEGAKAGEGVEEVTHEEVNLSCGDALTIGLSIKNDHVTGVGWEGSGCAISQAAMSLLSEELVGKSLKDIDAMKKETVYELLGVPVGPRRFKCALLCLHTLKNAVRKFRKEEVRGWSETVGG